jgi:hypothetical protein
MILFPLLSSWIWLQIVISARLPQRKPVLIFNARSKAEQDHSDNGNPIQ